MMSSTSSSFCRLLKRVFVVGILCSAFTIANAALLNVGGLELDGVGAKSGSVPIEFRSTGNVVALQMDVLFNTTAYTVGAAVSGTLEESFRVDSHLVEPGRLRVVVGAPANSALKDSVVFRVPITATSQFSSHFPVALANIVLSSPQSIAVAAQIAPSIRFTKLADGASLNGKKGILITADALAASGSVTKVSYYAGNTLLFDATKAPFTYTWNPSKEGSYQLRAVATDSDGRTTAHVIGINVFLNSPPVTASYTLAVNQNRKVAIPFSTLLARASDPDKDRLIISEYDERSAAGGVLDISGNTITYLPKKNFVGKDSFFYAVSDEVDGQTEAKVNLLVTRLLQTDLNLDRQADLVLVSEKGRGTLILTLGNGVLKGKLTGPKIPSGQQLAVVDDFNKDGKPDFLAIDPATRKTRVILLDGAKSKGSKTGPVVPAGHEIVAADDFNSDGETDLLLYDPKKRDTVIWYMKDFTRISAKKGPRLPSGWTVAGTDDFDNDGKPDLCLADVKKTQLVVWYLKDRVLSAKSAKIKSPSGFELAGVADFTSDGKPDLMFFNPKTRKTMIYRLDGVKLTRKSGGPTLSSGYRIVAPR